MHRFLLLLTATLMLLGLPADPAGAALADVSVAQSESDDCTCCDDDEGEADCCDWDGGACCATPTAALPTARALSVAAILPHPALPTLRPLHLLRPRDHGPPPLPPPIG